MQLAVNAGIGRRSAAGCSVLLICLTALPAAVFAQKGGGGSVVITPSAPAGESRPDRVLVLPFEPVGPTDAWRGRSVQQSLVADLTSAAPARVGAADTPASDAAAASAVAKQAGARFVVFGAVTSAGSELRYTGQVVDTTTGQSVAGLKATGPANDAFRLEDALASQVKQQLALGWTDQHRPAAATAGSSAPVEPRAVALPASDTRTSDALARGQIVIVPGRPRSTTQPAYDPADDPRNDVNGVPILPDVPLRGLDAADVYGGPIIWYPPCSSSGSCYAYSSGCYLGGFRTSGYCLGYGHAYGGYRGSSFGSFRGGGGSFGGFHGSTFSGGHSGGRNFASRR